MSRYKASPSWTCLAALLCFGLSGAAAASHIVDSEGPVNPGPDVAPFAMEGGNPVTCSAGQGNTFGLGYPYGLKIDLAAPQVFGTWNLWVTSGGGLVVVTGGSPPAGATSVGTIEVEAGASPNSINFSSTLPIHAALLKGGAVANVYGYVQPPNPPAGWPAIARPGPQRIDDNLVTTGQGISHVEFCFDIALSVSKTAETSYTRTWNWTIEKSVDPPSADVFYGDSHDFDFTVEVTKTGSVDSDFAVEGEITIHNPHPSLAATITAVTDAITGGINAPVTCPGGLPQALAGNGTLVCTYSASLPDASSRVNTATVTATGINGGSGTADVVFGAPTTVVNDSVTVDDSQQGELGTTSSSTSFDYTVTLDCAEGGDQGQVERSVGYDNTATIVETGQNDSASATLNCHVFDVDKSAAGSFDRTYDWDAAKLVLLGVDEAPTEAQAPACIQLAEVDFPGYGGRWACPSDSVLIGDGAPLGPVYLVSLVRHDNAAADSGFVVAGGISYSYPTAIAGLFQLASIADSIVLDSGGGPIAVSPITCGAPADNGGTTTVSCTYSHAFAPPPADGHADGGTNTATVTRTAICYDADGVAKGGCGLPNVSDSASAGFGFALDGETNACVNAFDLFNGAADIDAVDLFPGGNLYCGSAAFIVDEAAFAPDVYPFGIPFEVLFANADCEVEVPNLVRLASADSATTWDSDEALLIAGKATVCTEPDDPGEGCTYTPGYWKTHSICGPASWPNATWDGFLKGGVTNETAICRKQDKATVYQLFDGIAGESWLDALWTAPKGGNVYYILAHAYIAAHLNTLSGASTTPAVDAAMLYAADFFATHTPSTAAALKGAARNTATQNAGILDAYNNGDIGPGHCD